MFDNTGKPYDVSKILTPDFLFDEKAYENYSHVYLPITYVLSYAVQFAGLSALITHTTCWHGGDIWREWKKSLAERHNDQDQGVYQHVQRQSTSKTTNLEPSQSTQVPEPGMENMISGAEDVHSRLMKRYEDAPMSWYLITGIAMLAIGIFVVE